MGLDGIGRGSGAPRALTPSADVEARSGAKTFQVAREASPAPAEQTSALVPASSTPLERLRAGEIDCDRYLDLKVDDATAHLQGLGPEELETVRTVLRGQLERDPVLVDLVRQATGKGAT